MFSHLQLFLQYFYYLDLGDNNVNCYEFIYIAAVYIDTV